MEENKQHFQHIMFYCFKKGKNTTEHTKNICAVYGEGANWSNVSKVVCEVSSWRVLAGQCSGRHVEVNSHQIKILIENNQPHRR